MGWCLRVLGSGENFRNFHIFCGGWDATDDAFYSGDPDEITGWIRDVLCVETFCGTMCDGGVDT